MNASCSVPISMSHWTAYYHLMYPNLSIVHSCLNMKCSKDNRCPLSRGVHLACIKSLDNHSCRNRESPHIGNCFHPA